MQCLSDDSLELWSNLTTINRDSSSVIRYIILNALFIEYCDDCSIRVYSDDCSIRVS